MPDTELTTTLKMVDEASGVARSAAANVKSALAGIPGAAQPAGVALGTVNGKLAAITTTAPGMGQALAAGLGLPLSPAMALAQGVGLVKDVIGDSLGKASTFSQTITNIGAVSGATRGQLQQLNDTALALGMANDTGAASAQDVADAMFELSKAGQPVETIVGGAAKAVIQMKNASSEAGFGFAESAVLVSDATNAYSREQLTAAHAADTFVQTANASSTGLGQLKFAFSAVGPVASAIGLSFDDTATALGVLSQNALKGQDAGTSLKTLLLGLNPHTRAARDEFDALGITVNGTNNKFFDAQGHIRPLASIAGTLRTALAGLSDQERVTALQTMFGTDAVRAGAIIYGAGKDGVDAMSAAMANAGTAASTATAMQNTLQGHTEQLSSAMETLQISAGQKAAGGVDKLVQSLGALASSKGAQDAISGIGQTLGEMAGAVGKGIDTAANLGDMFGKMDAIQNVVLADMRHNLGLTSDAELEAAKQAAVAGVTHAQTYDTLRTDTAATVHGMRDDIDGDMHRITSLSQASAQDVHDMTLAQWQALHGDLNTEADGITADLGDKGYAAGNMYINSQGQGISDSDALVMNKIDALMQMYDIRDVLGHLGAASAQKFAEALARGLETSLGKLQTGLAGLGNLPGMEGLADKIKNLNNTIRVSAGDMVDGTAKAHAAWAANQQKMAAQADADAAKAKSRLVEHAAAEQKRAEEEAARNKKREEAAGRSAAAHERAEERKAVAAEKAAVREADAILKAQQTTIAALGKAAEAGQTSGDVLVAAMAGVKSAAEGNLPAVGKLWQHAVDDLQKGADLATVQASLRAGVQRLTSDPNASIAAWAKQQIDHLQELDDAAVAKAQKIATDLLKSQQSVISGFGKIGADVAQGTATTGDLLVALMEGAPAAAEAHLPRVAAVYKRMLGELQSATPPSLATLHNEFRAEMQALAADPNASIAAWGRQQLDALDKIDSDLAAKHQQEIDDWTAKERQAAQDRQDARDADAKKAQDAADAQAAAQIAVVQSMASAAEAVASGKNPLDVIIGLIPVLQQATAAGMPQVAALIQHWMDVAAKGGTVSLDEMRGALSDFLSTSGTGGGQGALYAQQAQAAVAAAQQQAAVNAQVAQYEQAIKGATATLAPYQAAIDATKASLDASNQALQEAQAAAQAEQTALQGAQTALQNFRNAKLQGEGAGNKAIHDNQHQQDVLSLEQAQLEAGPKSAESVKRLRDIKKELAELQAQQKIQQLEQKTTFDEQHYQLTQIGQDTHELTFTEAQAGATQAAQDVTTFTARLAEANARVADAQAAQKAAKDAADAATASYAAQKQVVDAQIASYKAQEDALKGSADATAGMATGMGTVATAAQTTAQTLGTALPQMTTALQTTQTTLATAAPALTATLAALGPAVQTGLGGVTAGYLGVFGDPNTPGTLLWHTFNHQPQSFKTLWGAYTEQMLATAYSYWWEPGLTDLDTKVAGFLHDTLAADARIGGQAVGAALGAGGVEGILGSIPDGQAAGRAWADAIMQAAKDEAGVHSPAAKWRDQVGRQQGAGGALGLQDSIPQGAAAGRAWAQAAQAGATGVGPLNVPIGGAGLAGMPGLPGAGGNTTHYTTINYQAAPGETPTQSAANGAALGAAFNERTMVYQGRNRGYGR